MSGTIHPTDQGRWRGQRRGSPGPTRGPLHPTMPLPDDIPAAGEEGEETEMSDDGQRKPSGNPGGIGGPSPAPPGPSNPPPPNPPSE
jgi:hypothetical protein